MVTSHVDSLTLDGVCCVAKMTNATPDASNWLVTVCETKHIKRPCAVRLGVTSLVWWKSNASNRNTGQFKLVRKWQPCMQGEKWRQLDSGSLQASTSREPFYTPVPQKKAPSVLNFPYSITWLGACFLVNRGLRTNVWYCLSAAEWLSYQPHTSWLTDHFRINWI